MPAPPQKGSPSTWPANICLCGAQGVRPKMVMEYWTGWFDSWGGPHHILDTSGGCSAGPTTARVLPQE